MHCARYGIPRVLISDNGPQFASQEFTDFVHHWGIDHKLTSPHHPSANGRAEAAVKTMKTLMSKCLRERSDPYEALMELRNTPKQDTHLSPAQVVFGRSTRTLLPSIHSSSKNSCNDMHDRREKRKQAVKKSYDKRAKDLPKLRIGQEVRFKRYPNSSWEKAIVVSQEKDRSYTVTADGVHYRRNRIHIRS